MPTLRSALYILETALAQGMNYFDTAPLYGSGYSEQIIGMFARGKRDKVIIASKVGLQPARSYRMPASIALPLNRLKRAVRPSPGPQAYNPGVLDFRLLTREHVQSSFEASLRRMKTDYIDSYLLHEAMPSFLEDQALDYLLGLKSSGRVRKLGLAASGINYVQMSPDTVTHWDVLQYEYSPHGTSKQVYELFPNPEHVLHSVLRNAPQADHIAPRDRAGYRLAQCIQNRFADRVLFSTSNVNRLVSNLRAFQSYLPSQQALSNACH